MNVRHLRAKYQIEQYPVVFTFPEQVLYEPTVRVEVVSGVDPNPSAFAGLPFVDGNLVSVVIVGGVPGVIYKIICEAPVGVDVEVQAGVVAVLPTAAAVPAGTPPVPFTETVTTPPYPAYVLDELIIHGNATPGVVVMWPLDELDLLAFAIDGRLRLLLASYGMLPEEIDLSGQALDGSHRLLLVAYFIPFEAVDMTSYSLNGTHKNVVIVYSNYAPEAVDLTSITLDGVHA